MPPNEKTRKDCLEEYEYFMFVHTHTQRLLQNKLRQNLIISYKVNVILVSFDFKRLGKPKPNF